MSQAEAPRPQICTWFLKGMPMITLIEAKAAKLESW